jgi:helicase
LLSGKIKTVKIEELKNYISSYAVDVLKEEGIEELFPPQVESIKKGLFERENFLLAIPTASGKTLIAEIAMVREIIEGGKCLYVVPLKALANEKLKTFRKWEKIGIKVGISTGDYEARDEFLADCDLIITTSEKADSLLRNEAGWIRKITCLVIDEIHLLDSANRGATLEVLITKMRRLNKELRIIGLSATIPNVKEIAEWLNARYVTSDWRPVPLYEGILCGKTFELYRDGLKVLEKKTSFEQLVEECVSTGGGVLVFEATRRNAEATAMKLSGLTSKYVISNFKLAKAILEENDGEMSRKLAECVERGCAFHHAGLLSGQRELIEDAFRRGEIKAIVATPTLAAGVNLPARRVIIKSLYRFDGYAKKIKVMEYKQMAGRAGRPGLDEYGEAIIITKRKDKKDAVSRYISGEPEEVTSKLGAENHLRFHSLSLIAEGFARNFEELEKFFSETFFFKQNEISVRYELERVVRQLENWEMVQVYDNFAPTSFGKLVSKLYIDPLTGFIFHDNLKRNELTEIGALHLICRTPDMERLYMRRSDDWIEDEVFSIRNELTYYPSDFSTEYDWFLAEMKTALCLKDWINEIDEDAICEKYQIAPGDLRRVLETAEWLSNALSRIAEFLGHEQSGFLSNLTLRIKHGVKDELVELVKLKGIGRVRARKLFDHGIRNISDLIENKSKVAAIIGKKIADSVLEQIDRL